MSELALILLALLIGCVIGWTARGESPGVVRWRSEAKLWRRVAENWRTAAHLDAAARKDKTP